MIHRLVTNVLTSFFMAFTPSLPTSTSAVNLQKTMASMFGGVLTSDLTLEGLANNQPQTSSTKVIFSKITANIFLSRKFNSRGTTDTLGWLLDDGSGDLSAQLRNSFRLS